MSLSVASLQSQSTIAVGSTELAPSAPQIYPLWGSPPGKSLLHRPGVSQTKEKGHWVPQTFAEADTGEGIWAQSHLPHGPTAPGDGVRWEATMFQPPAGKGGRYGQGCMEETLALLSFLFRLHLQNLW